MRNNLTEMQKFKQRAQNTGEAIAEFGGQWFLALNDVVGDLLRNIGEVEVALGIVNVQGVQSIGIGNGEEVDLKKDPEESKNIAEIKNDPREAERNQKKLELQGLAAAIVASKKVTQQILESDEKIKGSLKDSFGDLGEHAKKQIQTIAEFARHAQANVEQAKKRIADIETKQEFKAFERSIANLSPGEQAAASRDRAKDLQGQAVTAFKAGDLEEARKKFDEVDKILDKVYNHEAQVRKELEKLGVKFSEPIDDKQEQSARSIQVQLEKDLIQQQADNYKKVAAEVEKTKNFEERRRDLLKEINDLVGTAPGAAAPAKSWGGYMNYFAEGGPVGTDVVPAWLTPGEYIMNAQNTQKFFPQLVMMNQGITPNFQPTSNNRTTNIGDININVSDSGKNTVRDIGQQLRREIRRGTIRLDD